MKNINEREKDILNLCNAVLNISPEIQYLSNYDASTCPFCRVTEYYEEFNISKLNHATDCAYLIAKDLSTNLL